MSVLVEIRKILTESQMIANHRDLQKFLASHPAIDQRVRVVQTDSIGFDATIDGLPERFDFAFDSDAFTEILAALERAKKHLDLQDLAREGNTIDDVLTMLFDLENP